MSDSPQRQSLVLAGTILLFIAYAFFTLKTAWEGGLFAFAPGPGYFLLLPGFLLLFGACWLAARFSLSRLKEPPGSLFLRITLFLLQTLVLYLAGTGLRLLADNSPPPAVLIASSLTLSAAAAFALARTGLIFLSLARLFPGKKEEGFYLLLDMKELLDRSYGLNAIAFRMKGSIGFIAVRIANSRELLRSSGKTGLAFIRKQLLFLLTHNSRKYEPWARTDDKNTCVNVLVIGSRTELDLALARIRSLLEEHAFLTHHGTPQKVELTFASELTTSCTEDASTHPEERLRSAMQELLLRLGRIP